MMRKANAAVFGAMLLAGCAALPSSTNTNIQNFIAGLNNKLTSDLMAADATANVPVASSPGGVANQAWKFCLEGSGSSVTVDGLIGLQKTIQPLLLAATNANGGVVNGVVVASTFDPNGPTMQGWAKGIITDCTLVIQQLGSDVASEGVALTAISNQFQIAAAVAQNRSVPRLARNDQ